MELHQTYYTFSSYSCSWIGFASGAVSSAISSVTVGICEVAKVSDFWTRTATVAAGGISGGVTASMAGGDFWNATTIDEQLGYGIDAFFGGGAIVAPGLFTIPSTIWFFGGKQATYWYNSTTITPMIENGINSGLMINQPFK